ncbi:hypothetical protein [Legionella sp. W05-934-2]|uniref:hypothetical protein n=1 Tax=Legionella sp. W05-934-2 TaxID=1198649 RepID=UPI0034635B89
MKFLRVLILLIPIVIPACAVPSQQRVGELREQAADIGEQVQAAAATTNTTVDSTVETTATSTTNALTTPILPIQVSVP